MSKGHYNILFLSNRNTARSIFAESVINRLDGKTFKGFSAGIQPAHELDPLACDVLKVANYPIEGLRPKHWAEFARADAPPLDFVFTLCDPGAGEPVPQWPSRPVTADWRYPDPEKLDSEPLVRRREFAAMLVDLERQLRIFMQLPFRSLDEISLRARLRELGQGVEAR